MDFGWSSEFAQFRVEVQRFIKTCDSPQLRSEIAAGSPTNHYGPAMENMRAEIDARGWVKMCWPKDLGGEERSPWYQFILQDEFGRAGIPYGRGTATMIGPAVHRFGTEAQKAKYLPGIWSGEIQCALGYSEPNAGTDLASLETVASRDGDEWVINGQKLWTSGAHTSTHVWLAARTDPSAPKHRGISMFIVPLSSPGISVRPIQTMSGYRTNETFYTDVRVPHDALIGEPGRGWYILAHALDFERVAIGGGVGALRLTFGKLINDLRDNSAESLKQSSTRGRLAEIALDLEVAGAIAMANAAIVASGAVPTMEASMAKVWTTELRLTMSSTAMDLLGRRGALSKESNESPAGGELEYMYRDTPHLTFGGGTNEIQRDIIARRGLGLPR